MLFGYFCPESYSDIFRRKLCRYICPEGAAVRPAQGNALGEEDVTNIFVFFDEWSAQRANNSRLDKSKIGQTDRTVGPLGRNKLVLLAWTPRALPWAGRIKGLWPEQYERLNGEYDIYYLTINKH
jgi:hypothetical protein